MSKSYCFYKKDTMEAVAAFCVINTDISVDPIPKSTRNKLNRKIPYAKQRDWRNRSIPTQFRTSESTHSVMKMTMEWP
jgi:hypothetical protein